MGGAGTALNPRPASSCEHRTRAHGRHGTASVQAARAQAERTRPHREPRHRIPAFTARSGDAQVPGRIVCGTFITGCPPYGRDVFFPASGPETLPTSPAVKCADPIANVSGTPSIAVGLVRHTDAEGRTRT